MRVVDRMSDACIVVIKLGYVDRSNIRIMLEFLLFAGFCCVVYLLATGRLYGEDPNTFSGSRKGKRRNSRVNHISKGTGRNRKKSGMK